MNCKVLEPVPVRERWLAGCVCGWACDADGENAAVEAAHDHAFPGWRDLPAVDARQGEKGWSAKDARRLVDVYGSDWLDTGGPIRTWRPRFGLRHVPGRAPGGGYDMSAGLGDVDRIGGEVARARSRVELLAEVAAALDGVVAGAVGGGPLDEARMVELCGSLPNARHQIGSMGGLPVTLTVDPFWLSLKVGELGTMCGRDDHDGPARLAGWISDAAAHAARQLQVAGETLAVLAEALAEAEANRAGERTAGQLVLF